MSPDAPFLLATSGLLLLEAAVIWHVGHRDRSFDYEADARENHVRMMGHDLPIEERRARAAAVSPWVPLSCREGHHRVTSDGSCVCGEVTS